MNKEFFEQAFIHRLLIEQNYSLLIDANEQTALFPEQEEWEYKLKHSEPEAFEQKVKTVKLLRRKTAASRQAQSHQTVSRQVTNHHDNVVSHVLKLLSS